MLMSSALRRAFDDPGARRVELLTLSPIENIADPRRHLARDAMALCVASDRGVEASGIPFWPLLGGWIQAEQRLSFAERRAEIGQAEALVVGEAPTRDLFERYGRRLYYRLDLWSDGVPLEESYPLMAGPVADISQNTSVGGVRLSLADGDILRNVRYPSDTISLANFPDAPNDVVDVDVATHVIGPFPERLPCIPISADYSRFFVCRPFTDRTPTRVYAGGTLIAGWHVRRGVAVQDRWDYQELVLDEPVQNYGSLGGVYCSGGVGDTSDNAIALLLAAAGVSVDRRTQSIIRSLSADFPMSVLVNAQADAMEIVRQRLVPQTPYALTLHRGQVVMVPLEPGRFVQDVEVGGDLIGRTVTEATQTPLSGVFNAIEIRCSRDYYGVANSGSQPLMRVVRDAHHGPLGIRRLLASSEGRYGRRALVVDAADLAVYTDATGLPVRCPGAERLADLLATLHAFSHRQCEYISTWSWGVRAELGMAACVTDPIEGYVRTPVRVVGIRYTAAAPIVTLETIDAWGG